MLPWKSFAFYFYRKNALRAHLTLRDIYFLMQASPSQINWPIAFPAYMHLHVSVIQADIYNKPLKCLTYGVEALWVYNKWQLNNYIINEFLKAIAVYKTPQVSSVSVDYLFFRKI
jgi:hypothetical protein